MAKFPTKDFVILYFNVFASKASQWCKKVISHNLIHFIKINIKKNKIVFKCKQP